MSKGKRLSNVLANGVIFSNLKDSEVNVHSSSKTLFIHCVNSYYIRQSFIKRCFFLNLNNK